MVFAVSTCWFECYNREGGVCGSKKDDKRSSNSNTQSRFVKNPPLFVYSLSIVA